MQLPEIDPIELETLEAVIDALLEIFGSAIRDPLVGTGAGVAAFRGDDESFRIRMQRLGDKELTCLRPIGIGRIDEVYPKFDRAFQNALRFLAIFRPTPDPVARDPHRAEPEPVHSEVAADSKRTTRVRFGSE